MSQFIVQDLAANGNDITGVGGLQIIGFGNSATAALGVDSGGNLTITGVPGGIGSGDSAWILAGADEVGFIKPSTAAGINVHLEGHAGGRSVQNVTAYRTTGPGNNILVINIPASSSFVYNHEYDDDFYWVVKRAGIDERLLVQVDGNIPPPPFDPANPSDLDRNDAHSVTINAAPSTNSDQRILRYADGSEIVSSTIPATDFGTMADPVAVELWAINDVTRSTLAFGTGDLAITRIADNSAVSLVDGVLTISAGSGLDFGTTIPTAPTQDDRFLYTSAGPTTFTLAEDYAAPQLEAAGAATFTAGVLSAPLRAADGNSVTLAQVQAIFCDG